MHNLKENLSSFPAEGVAAVVTMEAQTSGNRIKAVNWSYSRSDDPLDATLTITVDGVLMRKEHVTRDGAGMLAWPDRGLEAEAGKPVVVTMSAAAGRECTLAVTPG